MHVTTHNINATVENQLQTPRLVIIEFALGELPARGAPGQALELSLAANYLPNPNDLHYKKVVFNIKNDTAFARHTTAVTKKVKKLRKL